MFESLEQMPLQELERRWEACRNALAVQCPQAGGLMVFSKLNIYYLSGTMASGVFWLPRRGNPVLLLRRGIERARLESTMENILAFRSYRDLEGLVRETGGAISEVVAAEMNGLPWGLAGSLQKHLHAVTFRPGDGVVAKARSVKSEWELGKMRLCGRRHHECLHELICDHIRPGMTEREISHKVWEVFFSRGHMGVLRMGSFGEECFLGHVAAGDSGNYPSIFNGPLGLRGEHPAISFMGYAGKIWKKGEPLGLDCGFSLEGYCTDKTQTFWAGGASNVPEEARRAQSFCLDVQNWVAENLKPGSVPSTLYSQCLDWAEQEGMAEGFMALPPNNVNFLGHGIGLSVDGYPVLAKGFDEPLELHQTLAVEPKVGIPGLGMMGVENTFVVTETGGECLTGDVFDMICIE
jgi:Xaa-Pro aminopeptidase